MTLKNKQAMIGRPQPAPAEYAGEWVAWNEDETRIVAHGTELAKVRAAAVAAGVDDPIFQKVRRPNAVHLGP